MLARLSFVVLLVAACAPSAATPPSSPTARPSASVAASGTPAPTPRPTVTPTPRPAVLPGESWLAFQAGDGRDYGVRLVRPDGTDQFFPTDTIDGTEQLHPDWSPDGTRLVFSAMGLVSRDLWVTDADGGNPIRVVACDTCTQADEPAWSPDGRSIAFHRQALVDTDMVSTLEILDVASGTARVVLTAPDDRSFYAPRWSPDGTRLVAEYVHRTAGSIDDITGVELVIVDLAAGTPTITPITDVGSWSNNPDWSPAGDRIVFSRPADPPTIDGPSDLWTIAPDGTAATRITSLAQDNRLAVQPTYTPDGSQVVFVTGAVGENAVMGIVAAGGGEVTSATSGGFIEGVHPRFRPTP